MTPEQQDRRHGDLLAVDPGVRSPGVALFRHGVLVACARVRVDKDIAAMTGGARWLRVGQQVMTWYMEQLEDLGNSALRTVVYECPQWYTQAKSKGDPNDLVGLVGVGQSVAVLAVASNAARDVRPPDILTPLPSEWTGQLPKVTSGDAWASPRGARVASRLEPAERALVPAQHDAIDGCGVGLYALGRYDARRAFSGAI